MKIVVFTDLDGTLLDHESYSFQAAEPALAELKRLDVPLILASSKTAAEIAQLHAALHLGTTPAIVENGAGLYEPGAADGNDATQYDHLRRALRELPSRLGNRFRGFGDMDSHEIARLTGLAEDAAALARQRCFSEPGVWTGTESERAPFLDALADHGISARRGGRFLTLSHGKTKADAMRDLVRPVPRRIHDRPGGRAQRRGDARGRRYRRDCPQRPCAPHADADNRTGRPHPAHLRARATGLEHRGSSTTE